MSRKFALLLIIMICALTESAYSAPTVRLKDIANLEGVRDNQLVGMGLVVGLNGTGDKSNLSIQMLRNMTSQFGLTVNPQDIKSKNVAVVSVTAKLPPFVKNGQNIDVAVSSIGDAKSLQGGVLLQTPLKAADGQIYAVAQGPILVGGFAASGPGANVQKNSATVGVMPGGAIVEREVPTDFVNQDDALVYMLKDQDFTTAQRIATAINDLFGPVAKPDGAGSVTVRIPPVYRANPVDFISQIEAVELQPDIPARVVVNERTGTIVMGENVKISKVAVSHGNLTIRVTTQQNVSQPLPFSQGQTAITNDTNIGVNEKETALVEFPESATVGEIVAALNKLGATPRDIISILQAIKQAGALHAELVVM